MPATQAPDIQEHRFPCDQCGADFRYDPKAGQLICDHCGNAAPIEGVGRSNGAIRELDFNAALRAQLPEADLQVINGGHLWPLEQPEAMAVSVSKHVQQVLSVAVENA